MCAWVFVEGQGVGLLEVKALKEEKQACAGVH